MDINEILESAKNSILDLVKEKYNQRTSEIEKDVDEFLKESKDKIARWTGLLEQEQLSKEEFELLLYAQKDLFVIKSLYQAGISKISLGHLKNNIAKIIVSTVIKLIL